MKKFFTYNFLLLFPLAFAYLSSHAQWHQKEFMIGTFMDPAPEGKAFRLDSLYFDNKVQMVHDAYFNFLSGYTSYNNNSLEFLKFKLGILNHYKMYSMYYASGGFKGANLVDAIKFTHNLPDSLRKYFLGYYLYDEPHPANINFIKYLISRVKIMDNDKLAYVNLFPVYWFNSKNQYEQYLDSLLIPGRVFSSDVVSYDFYPFPDNGFRSDYYYNLSIIRQKAGNRPFWFYILATPHGPYDDPTLYQLSFMAFNPICYGAKGYMVFTYIPPPYNKNYQYTFGNAIIARDGKPTNKLDYITTINRFVKDIIGPVVMRSKFLGSYHVSNQPYHQWIPDSEYLNESIPLLSRIGNENMLAGIFKDTTYPGDYYIFLVNKSPFSQNNVFITFKGDYTEKVKVSSSHLNYKTGGNKFNHINAIYDRTSNETHIFLDFYPGEGRLIKVSQVTDPFQHIIKPDNFDFEIMPNPFRNNCKVIYSLTQASDIRMSVYSLEGRLQQEVIKATHLLAGKYYQILNFHFDTPGIYFLVLQVNNKPYAKKIIFLGY